VKYGGNILLFVRQRRLAEWGTAPYTLLGPAEYVSHTGDRPIQFVWRLRRAMPADFLRGAKVAAGEGRAFRGTPAGLETGRFSTGLFVASQGDT
jgi:hypothetical protein